MRKSYFFLWVFLLFYGMSGVGYGQTNPAAQSLPYTQNFGTSTFTTMPAGMAAWNGLSGATITTQSGAEGSSPSGNGTVTAATTAQTGGGVFGYSVSSNGRVYIQTSSNTTNGVNQVALAINTTGRTNITVAYDVEIISAQPRTVGIVMQYRIGTSGSWTTVTATGNPYSQAGGTTGVKANVSLTLPSAADNQSVVQIRWATWRGTESGNSSGVAIDNISISGSLSTPSITLADNGTQIAAGNILQGATDHILSTFKVTVATANATLNSITFTPFDTYVAGDVTNYKLYTNTTNTFPGGTALKTIDATTSVGGGDDLTFSSISQVCAVGDRFFWITADIPINATPGNTIFIPGLSAENISFASGNPASGSISESGAQTITEQTEPSITVSENSLTGFIYVEGSGPSSSQTYSLSGTNLTPASGNLTVTGSTNYEVSTDNSSFGASKTVPYTGGTLGLTTIHVRLKAGLSAGTYNSETIANSGGGATTVNVTASGSVSYAEPSTQASNVTFTSVSGTGFTINWTSGNGSKRLVVVKSGGAVNSDPTDGVTYTANTAFGSGTQIGTGNYVVYNDNGSSVAVTGLTSGTTYHVAVYEYNGGSGSENYRTSDEATGSQMTTLNAVYFDGSATYTQNFNTLASSGTSSTLPTGWYLSESGTGANTTYAAGTGSDNGGNTYSFGESANSERALGGLQSGSVIPTIGMAFVNNTGSIITDLPISYTGEQWRLGATGRNDRLDFQYSTNATSLSSGTWTDFNSLDFNAPITTGTLGALPGNNSTNRSVVAATITGLSVTHGSVIWIRWNDFAASGANDGLAVDDFQIVVQPASQATSVNFTGVTTTGFTINWTNGSGSNRVVLLKSGSAVDSDPVDGTTYTANAAFGSGTQIGTGNYVVYNGSGTSVAVTGLTSGVTYYAAVYEYDGLSAVTNYLTTSPATGNQATLAPAIAISSPSQVVTGNIFKGSDDNVISKFQLAVTTVQATVTSISVPLAGTYLAADIKASGLKLWYNSTNSFSGATQLGTSQSSASEGTGETVSFSSLSQNISADATGYFFVTASIANEAGDDKTIYAGAMSADNFTVSSGNKSGTTTQGGTLTIIPNPAPVIEISADPALTEGNLHGAVITITLTNVEFDGDLATDNFTLNNVPSGTSIGSLEYVSTNTARCTLAYDGTDFDANITNFSITIADAQLVGEVGNITSSTLTITATVEVVPTVTTNEAITSKSSTSAVWGGEATATGGENIAVKGIVWSTSASPTVELETKTTEGSGLGAITGNMTGLSPNTTYYVRAYATNSVGTGYGTERSFTTDGLGTPPTASAATNITSTGFTANWGSVSGASSYRLDVATDENFTSNTILSENFVGFTTNNGTTDRSGSLNTYLQTTGWTGTAIYEMIGYAKLGAGSTRGVITTPTVDLSGNSGNHILEFDLGKFGTDNTSVEVYHAPDGTTFAQVGTDIVAPASITTQTVQIAGGTAASKLRIQANLASSNRFYLDNFIVKTSNILTSHNNKEVNGTSENVSGLSSGTTYYYRVRGFSANSTSGNSGVITVRTADNSQSASVSTGNNVSAPVNGATGVEEVLFTSVATGGNINVARFNEPPTGGTSGITGNISQYRLIIEPDNVLVFDEQAGYKLRFKASDLPGITTRPENLNTTSVRLHKRSTPGSGEFSAAITMTYYRNEDPALDYLESDLITNGFSEFIFSSPDQPLPVELVSFTAKVKSSAVHLQWETATEVNNYGFEVERSNATETMNASSTQGRTWQKIGFVEGNGNSNSPKSYSFTDRNASAGKYIYRLKQVDTDGAFDYSDEVAVDLGTPAQFSLSQNYPNPFNPSTLVQYAVPVQSVVVLEIYDITGTRVAQPVNALHEPGSYSALFNLSDLNLASGTYIYRLSATDMSGNIMYSAINKMLLLK
ncbi:MAG: T9SS type A sorting domain-containing protein [Ignavibacteriaceae bacterium]|nr:T9SS type A sorting domain-containing protein [Ignavibacteriaceae bacterium]